MSVPIPTRIEEGVNLLTKIRPDWRHVVDTERLNISSCTSCVLGQLYGEYDTGLRELAVMGLTVDEEYPARYGFDIGEPDFDESDDDDMGKRAYQRLTAIWRRYIEATR